MATTTTIEETLVTAINGPDTANPDGNVSVTETDKAADKAKAKPAITFSVNVDANYARLTELASKSIDEEGTAQSVHAFIKYHVFHTIEGLTWTGEVQRKVGAVSDEALANSMLGKVLGLAAVKAMSAADRQKMEKVILNAIDMDSEQMQRARAAVQGGLAAAVQREQATKLAK